jgi:hypothetical protein
MCYHGRLMTTPSFDEKGYDRTTFAPFALQDSRATKWKDLRLTFDDWGAITELAGDESVDGYYLNGYGVEGLVKGAMVAAGIDVESDAIDWNSVGDTCNIHFKDYDTALSAAAAAHKMLASREALVAAVAAAREGGFED